MTLIESKRSIIGSAFDIRFEWPHLCVLFAVGLLFRYPTLTNYSLWLDEAWRVALAEAPLNNSSDNVLFAMSQVISYPGLLRLALYLFGHSETAVRLTSVLAGAAAVPMTYRLGRVVFDKKPAVLAALLLCLSPLHITYSQEAAAYAIASLATLVFFVNLSKLPTATTIGTIFFLVTAAFIMVSVHTYLLLLVILAMGLDAFGARTDRRFLLILLACALLIIVLSLPSLFYMFTYADSGGLQSWSIGKWILSYPFRIGNAIISGPFPDAYTPTSIGLIPKFISSTVALALAISLPLSLVKIIKAREHAYTWLAASVLYVIFLIAQSFLTNNAEVRYVVPILPLIFIFLASAVIYIQGRFGNAIAVSILIAILAIFLLALENDPPGRKWKPNARDIAAQIGKMCSEVKGVMVIIPEVFELPIYEFYLRGVNCHVVRQPAFEDYFHKNNRAILFRSTAQLAAENAWFESYLLENDKSISTVYLVSERAKERALQISDVASRRFRHVTESEFGPILVLKLEK